MKSLILDNPVFNVKGEGKEMLQKVLELGIACTGNYTFKGYRIDDKKGIVLYWTDSEIEGYQKFMIPSKAEDIVDQVFQSVLNITVDIKNDEYLDKPANDYDVEDELGWRVYTEKWGYIGDEQEACLAVIPSYFWIGK